MTTEDLEVIKQAVREVLIERDAHRAIARSLVREPLDCEPVQVRINGHWHNGQWTGKIGS